MSKQAALAYLQRLRRSAGEADDPAALPESVPELLEAAREAGFVFTEDELREAFPNDWAMRWMHYSRRGPASPGDDTASPSA